MASIISKLKGHRLYYYVVESARVNGKPRIVSRACLGTAERVAALAKDRTAPLPLAAARQAGVFSLLESLWPTPPSGPSTAHYLLLAAIQRVCQPGPKTDVAAWYRRTILHSLWGFPPERFTWQAFRDCFDQIQATGSGEDDLDRAQLRLLGLWNEKQLVSRRLLACDSTNFYTDIASVNTATNWRSGATMSRAATTLRRSSEVTQ
jgi:hypothetical protein